MRTIHFTVEGQPRGYVTRTYRGRFSPGAAAAHDYMNTVKLIAQAAGVPIPVPATFENPAILDVDAYYQNLRGPDPENVKKLIQDALFPSKQGGDRYVAGSHGTYLVDPENPRVEVTVTWDPATPEASQGSRGGRT